MDNQMPAKATVAIVESTSHSDFIHKDEIARIIEICCSKYLDQIGASQLRPQVEKACSVYMETHSGECSSCADANACTIHTRLSQQRIKNLRRQRSHYFKIDQEVQPGETKSFQIPAFLLGRVVEWLQFRPTMDTNGNPDDLKITITGEDGVLWATFSGGKHSQDACCLLEAFDDDCIGWGEGFIVTIEHTGEQGAPAMLSAVLDWYYIFEGQNSSLIPAWKWPNKPRSACRY